MTQKMSQERLEALLSKAAPNGVGVDSESHKASRSQMRMYFEDQTTASKDTVHSYLAFSSDRLFDVDRLSRAWQKLLKQHTILRTSFRPTSDGAIVERSIQENRDDYLTEMKYAAREAAFDELFESFKNHVTFDLGLGRLSQIQLIHSEERSYIFIAIHHIAFDGASVRLLMDSLMGYYDDEQITGTRCYFPEPKDTDLAQLDVQILQISERFTDDYLKDVFFYNEEDDQPHSVNASTLKLDQAATDALQQFSQQYSVAKSTILLAALECAIWKYTSHNSFNVNFVTSTRSNTQEFKAIGCYTNSVIKPVKIEGSTTILDYLVESQNIVDGVLEERLVPVDAISMAIAAKDPVKAQYIGQIHYAYNYEEDTFTTGNHSLRRIPIEDEGLLGKLTADVRDTEDTLTVRLLGCNSVFKSRHLDGILQYIEYICHCLSDAPDLTVACLNFHPAKDREALSNLSVGRIPSSSKVQQVKLDLNSGLDFCFKAFRDLVAIEDNGVAYQYHQLEDRVNTACAFLDSIEVKPGQRIATIIDKSIDLIVCQIAAIRMNCSFLTIDPTLPQKSIQTQLEKAQVSYACCSPEIALRLPTCLSIFTANELRKGAATNCELLGPRTSCFDDEAYIVFTSGTTGVPKAISNTHGALASLALERSDPMVLSESRILHTSRLSFDAAIMQIWTSLFHGGILVVDSQISDSLYQLARTIREKNINTVWLSPAIFRQLMSDFPNSLEQIRFLNSGGEKADPSTVTEFLKRSTHQNATFANGYGPAENGVNSTWYFVNKDDSLGSTVPIGKAGVGRCQYLLDESLNEVPYGAPGMLYVSGDGVANGYINEPAKTAKNFLPNPFDDSHGSRLYRTGDLVRYNNDGDLLFLGRKDQQVKLRGIRIELSGIENDIQAFTEVSDTHVCVRIDTSGSEVLVAFCVLKDNSDADKFFEKARTRLATNYADYYIPNHFIKLDRLPTNASGKIDSRQLPDIDPDRFVLDLDNVSCTELDDVELRMKKIFETVLGFKDLPINKGFFRLGGHSLLLLRVIEKIRVEFNVSLSVPNLMSNDTIIQAAQLVLKTTTNEQNQIQTVPMLNYEQIDLIQELEKNLSSISQYNVPLFVELSAETCRSKLISELKEVLKAQKPLNIMLDPNDPVREDVIINSEVSISERDLSLLDHSSQVSAINIRTADLMGQSTYGYNKALYTAELFCLGTNEYVLLLCINHVVIDMISGERLKRRLIDCTSVNHQSKTALTFDHAHWQRSSEYLTLERRALNYWLNKLQSQTYICLPFLKNEKTSSMSVGKFISAIFSEQTLLRLLQLQSDIGCSLNSLLAALLKLYVLRLTPSKSAIVFTPVSTRNENLTYGDSGFFVNLLPSTSVLDNNDSITSFINKHNDEWKNDVSQMNFRKSELSNRLRANALSDLSELAQVCMTLEHRNAVDTCRETDSYEVQSSDAKFPLSFDFTISEFKNGTQQLCLDLNYNSIKLSPKAASWYLEGSMALIEEVVTTTDPDRPISSLSILQSHVVGRHNPSAYQSVVERFEFIVKQYGNRSAVVTEDTKVYSYDDIQKLSLTVSASLRQFGVLTGKRVLLVGSNSHEYIYAYLGILRQGASVVPADPMLPIERLNLMSKEAGCEIGFLCSEAASITGLIVPTIASDSLPTSETQAQLSTLTAFSSSSEAYVMYTSGTSGLPKGVSVTHENVLSLTVHDDLKVFYRRDVVLNSSSCGFDSSTWEIFGALLNGGCVVPLSKKTLLDKSAFSSLVHTHQPTKVFLTPTLARQFLTWCPSIFRLLRELWLGGEVLDQDLVAAIREIEPSILIVNGYGPTESTTFTTMQRIEKDAVENRPIPIGDSYPNREIYVLDENLNMLPQGTVGEIFIGGKGVSNGYVNSFSATAASFLPNPFVAPEGQSGSRMYRTGDLGKVNEYGTVDYLGRTGNQVKIRGYRIELKEIESQIRGISTVVDAHVYVGHNDHEEKNIVAMMVLRPESEWADVDSYLRQQLPFYMVPRRYQVVRHFEMNANGKFDIEATKRNEVVQTDFKSQESKSETETETEAVIREVWIEILGHQNFNNSTGFFQAGGDSISVLRVSREISQRIYQDISVTDCFTFPTVKSIAEYIDTQGIKVSQTLPRTRRRGYRNRKESRQRS